MSNTIGDKIRQLRTVKGLKQETMADEIGMSHGNYGKIERGEIDVSSTHLIQIAKTLKVNVGEFFEDKISLAKESKTDYGFITKHEFDSRFSELAHTMLKLTKAVEKLQENPPKKKAAPKKKYNKAKK